MVKLEKIVKGLKISGGVALALSLIPIPRTWFGYQKVEHNGKGYSIRQFEDQTKIFGGGENHHCYPEEMIDRDNDGRLDSRYCYLFVSKVGYIPMRIPLREEDQELYHILRNKVGGNN